MNKVQIILFFVFTIFITNYSLEPAPKKLKTAEEQNGPWLQFINEEKAVQVDPEIVSKFATLKNMIEDLGQTTQEDYLPMSFSRDRWQALIQSLHLAKQMNPSVFANLFQTLGHKASQDLLNDFNYLEGPQNILFLMIEGYQEYMISSGILEINQLVPDLQKLVISPFFRKAVTFVMHMASSNVRLAQQGKKQFSFKAKPDESFTPNVAYEKKHDLYLVIIVKKGKYFLQALNRQGTVITERELIDISSSLLPLTYNEKRSLIIITSKNHLKNNSTTLIFTLTNEMNFTQLHHFNLSFFPFCESALEDNNNLIYLYNDKSNTGTAYIINLTDFLNPQYLEKKLPDYVNRCRKSETSRYIIYKDSPLNIHYLNTRELTDLQFGAIERPSRLIQFYQFMDKNNLLLASKGQLLIANLSHINPRFKKTSEFKTLDRIYDSQVNFEQKTLLIQLHEKTGLLYVTKIFSFITQQFISLAAERYFFLNGTRLLYHSSPKFINFLNMYPDDIERFAQNNLDALEHTENSLEKMLFIIKVVNHVRQEKTPFIIFFDSSDEKTFNSLSQELQNFLLKNNYVAPEQSTWEDWQQGLFEQLIKRGKQ